MSRGNICITLNKHIAGSHLVTGVPTTWHRHAARTNWNVSKPHVSLMYKIVRVLSSCSLCAVCSYGTSCVWHPRAAIPLVSSLFVRLQFFPFMDCYGAFLMGCKFTSISHIWNSWLLERAWTAVADILKSWGVLKVFNLRLSRILALKRLAHQELDALRRKGTTSAWCQFGSHNLTCWKPKDMTQQTHSKRHVTWSLIVVILSSDVVLVHLSPSKTAKWSNPVVWSFIPRISDHSSRCPWW